VGGGETGGGETGGGQRLLDDALPRYPLLVGLPGGRVQHAAKLAADGEHVFTLCRKRGRPDGDGGGLPYCRACANRPNPISQQAGR
ncbi:hypothetical protein, partial [Streptomyces albidoflavus]|uniref:hypothetical protein n=1 Tax=Streptomyces albidoflavus TaxID=1886 RepID=UPI0033D40316